MEKKAQYFEKYKGELLKPSQELNPEKLESWVYSKNKEGLEKELVYEILQELFLYNQNYNKAEGDESYYGFLADFLYRFTVWSKKNRILPKEPDCK